MKKLLLGCLLAANFAAAHELNVVCEGIIPDQIRFAHGQMLTDTFKLSEKLGYFDDAQTRYGLIQSVKILNADGDSVRSLSVARQFYPDGECGPSQIVADNKSFDRIGNDATYRIEINIDNTCDAENTSSYSLYRNGKTPITKGYTRCVYERN